VERHLSIAEREEREVLAQSDIIARVEVGSDLTHQDVSGANLLTTEALYASVLGVRVSTIPRRSLSLFMRHGELLVSYPAAMPLIRTRV
jgi:hypothetical protein